MNRALEPNCFICATAVDRFLLHNLRHRATDCRLCTACVLVKSPGSFCPICFDVFDKSPPPKQRLMCLKCPSITHSSCVSESNSNYECKQCRNPDFAKFSVDLSSGENRREFDEDSARKFLAASKIGCISMRKAADVARDDAEVKVHEARMARMRAIEAVLHFEKEKNNKS